MKILLLFPLNESYESIISAGQTAWKSKLNPYKNIKKLDCAYPTGILSISAYLKKNLPSAEIKILDVNAVMNHVAASKHAAGEGFEGYGFLNLMEEAAEALADFKPDVVGVSTLFCSNYADLKELADWLRRRFPGAATVCGGHLAASVYRRMYADGIDFDAIGFGEGEVPMLELASAVERGGAKDYLAGSPLWITAAKAADKAFRPQAALLTDLDEIPPFDFSMLVFSDAYFNSTKYFFVIDSKAEQKEMFIFSSRGCQYTCVFCASQNVHGHRVRTHSVERIKSDILNYNKNYGITRFVFYDDHFLSGKQRALEILEFIRLQGFTAEIPTPAFFSVDKDVAAAMGRGGIKEVNITIESGNEQTLKTIMRKPGSLKRAEETVALLHEQGIVAVSNILIGLPGETPESIEAGLQYLLTTKIDWFQCFVVAPLPGSELYSICDEKGYLAPGFDLATMDYKKCLVSTPDFTPEFIEKKAYEMNLRLNFVSNTNMRDANYARALMFFERVITAVIDTHAFAYYFAAKCCKALGQPEKYSKYKVKYAEMTEKYEFWRNYSVEFKLEPLD